MKTEETRPPLVDWSELFNALPIKSRRIGQAMECITRIQQLLAEKQRIKESANRSIADIDAHIKNLRRTVRDLEEHHITTTPETKG